MNSLDRVRNERWNIYWMKEAVWSRMEAAGIGAAHRGSFRNGFVVGLFGAVKLAQLRVDAGDVGFADVFGHHDGLGSGVDGVVEATGGGIGSGEGSDAGGLLAAGELAGAFRQLDGFGGVPYGGVGAGGEKPCEIVHRKDERGLLAQSLAIIPGRFRRATACVEQ